LVVFGYWSQGRGHADKKRMAALGKLVGLLSTRILAIIMILSIVSVGMQVMLLIGVQYLCWIWFSNHRSRGNEEKSRRQS